MTTLRVCENDFLHASSCGLRSSYVFSSPRRSEPDEGVDQHRFGEDDDPRRGLSDQDERVVRGPVDGEQDDDVQREQEQGLAAQLGRVARLASGPQRSARPAEDELRRPVGDDHGAEHDHGHGGRGLLALEHHVQEHVGGR